jgi:hypothetical protein
VRDAQKMTDKIIQVIMVEITHVLQKTLLNVLNTGGTRFDNIDVIHYQQCRYDSFGYVGNMFDLILMAQSKDDKIMIKCVSNSDDNNYQHHENVTVNDVIVYQQASWDGDYMEEVYEDEDIPNNIENTEWETVVHQLKDVLSRTRSILTI